MEILQENIKISFTTPSFLILAKVNSKCVNNELVLYNFHNIHIVHIYTHKMHIVFILHKLHKVHKLHIQHKIHIGRLTLGFSSQAVCLLELWS